jgi:hypothetical protein
VFIFFFGQKSVIYFTGSYLHSKTVSPKDLCQDCYSYSPVIKHTLYILTKKNNLSRTTLQKAENACYFFLWAKNCNIFYRFLSTFKNCQPKRFVLRLLLLFSCHKTHFLYFDQKNNLWRTTLQRAEKVCF